MPSSLTINQGDTVTWINTGGTHDVNGDVNSQTGSSFNNPVSFYLSVNSPDTIGSLINSLLQVLMIMIVQLVVMR